MKKKYIIFDFDGTLMDTNRVILDSWQATFERYLGQRRSRREVEATFGEVLMDTIRRIIPDADPYEVRDYYRAYQDSKCQELVTLFDGISELLSELRARGCMIGVATSRTTRSFWGYMRQFGLEDAVDEVVTMDDVSMHKPHPETLTRVMEKMGADPASTIMVGDTKYDIGCANNAGVDSVLVGWSHYIDEEDMAKAGFVPTYRIDTPAELLSLI
jgi:pyrophosphatase PpaX